MKLKELKKIAEDSGYTYIYGYPMIYFEKDGIKNIEVSLKNPREYGVSILNGNDDKDRDLIYAAEEFSNTEMNDREIFVRSSELMDAINCNDIFRSAEISAINDENSILITWEGKELVSISKRVYGQFSNEKDLWNNLSLYYQQKLIQMINNYILTPIPERVGGMKFFLVHKFMRGDKNLCYPAYLMQCNFSRFLYIGNDVIEGRSYSRDRKTFTIEEIKAIKDENNTKLDDFYRIPDTDKNREILFNVKCVSDFNIEKFEIFEVEV